MAAGTPHTVRECGGGRHPPHCALASSTTRPRGIPRPAAVTSRRRFRPAAVAALWARQGTTASGGVADQDAALCDQWASTMSLDFISTAFPLRAQKPVFVTQMSLIKK
eukprot:Hpha_TRINITY_DN23706_c0_g1::TRINITY_DN23706_c0_g1_i1::g.93248::m.93248